MNSTYTNLKNNYPKLSRHMRIRQRFLNRNEYSPLPQKTIKNKPALRENDGFKGIVKHIGQEALVRPNVKRTRTYKPSRLR